VEPLEPVPLWPYVEPVLVLFWFELPAWPLFPIVSLDFAVAPPEVVPVDPLALGEVSPVDVEPCVVVPVSDDARVFLLEPEQPTSSAAAPSAVMM
jgi:hypothetical protein